MFPFTLTTDVPQEQENMNNGNEDEISSDSSDDELLYEHETNKASDQNLSGDDQLYTKGKNGGTKRGDSD